MRYVSFIIIILFCSGCLGTMNANLPVVDNVDLARYMGRWFEVARYPNRFQRNCKNSRATYTLRPDGKVDVLNECERGGDTSSARGTAWVVDPLTNAKLKVSFFWPFRGDYWIMMLGEDYEYSVVSAPSMNYLWILSRKPDMPIETLAEIEQKLEKLGFETGKLVYNLPTE